MKKKIKQILYHLIDNAIKFSNDNSKITFGYTIEKEDIIFFVTNTGDQIAEDKKKNIFEIFEKQDMHNNKFVSGLGIGLPLAKRLTELLKGKIYFQSNDYQTTFFCSIPINKTASI